MKFLIINDLATFKKNFKSIFFFYFVPIIIYGILLKVSNIDINEYTILNIFSLNIEIETNNIIAIIICLISLFAYIYITYLLFFNDLNYQKEFIFLRIKISKWIAHKLTFLAVIIFVLFAVKILFFSILFNIQIFNYIIILMKGYLYFLLESLFLILMFANYKEMFSLLLFVFLNVFIGVNIVEISYLFLIMELIVIFILIIHLIKRNKLLERR